MKFRTTALLAGAFALAACSDQSVSPVAAPQQAPLLAARGTAIEGSYVVVLKPGADPRAVAAVAGVSPKYVYDAAVNGFAGTLNAGQLNALQKNPNVAYVEPDQVVTASVVQSNATWGLDRIDQRALPLSLTYSYTATAGTVRAYVIDTGLQTSHPQFGNPTRAQNVYDAFGGSGNDCNGHGTHVAGTIGSTTYGVAKSVMLRGVKVLDCNGSGSLTGILNGINWLISNHIKPAVANLSLGAGYSSTLNTAVTNLANAGVFVAVAAGNENQNACNVSPASAPAVTTVAATSKSGARWVWNSTQGSNFGSCVDLYAPGDLITSTWINSGTNTITGTSMASPHVAGVAALYKSGIGDHSQATIDSWIKTNSTANTVTNNPTGTPNRLLFKSTL